MTAPPPPAGAALPRGSRALVDDALTRVETLDAAEALRRWRDDPATLFVDLREDSERTREGSVPGAVHVPRGVLEFQADPASAWHRPVLSRPGTRLLLYCAIGWRSALAAETLQSMGIAGVAHVGGGFAAWREAGGPVAHGDEGAAAAPPDGRAGGAP